MRSKAISGEVAIHAVIASDFHGAESIAIDLFRDKPFARKFLAGKMRTLSS
jgi:hypothetical protein